MISAGLIPLGELGSFFIWWVAKVPAGILDQTRLFLIMADDVLEFGANLRLWIAIEPLFGDYTWSGRVVGFLIRGIRVIASAAVYLAILITGLLLMVGWFIIPVFIATSIFSLWPTD